MATYIYYCEDCEELSEVQHAMFSTQPVICPCCGSERMSKRPCCPAIVFDWKYPGFDEGVVVGPQRFRGPAVPQSVRRIENGDN